jgi:hypothetical protein
MLGYCDGMPPIAGGSKIDRPSIIAGSTDEIEDDLIIRQCFIVEGPGASKKLLQGRSSLTQSFETANVMQYPNVGGVEIAFKQQVCLHKSAVKVYNQRHHLRFGCLFC